MALAGDTITFINVEWFLRLIYVIVSFFASLGTGLLAILGSFFDGRDGVGVPSGENGFLVLFNNLWATFIVLSTIVSLIFATIAVYAYLEIKAVLKKEDEALEKALILPEGEASKDVNPRWEHIKTLMNSHNQNDWRQAIIEADIMLDEMLNTQGYHASSVGDKLKQVEPADMTTLNDAWEAHKIRNSIAHGGSSFLLTEQMARSTITLYEAVFLEFSLI